MSVSRLRLEENSIFNYIKYQIISPNFSEQLTEDLVYNSSLNKYVTNSSMDPSPTSLGRGWVFFDDSNASGNYIVDLSEEQTEKVSVTGASSYTIDYLNGRISDPDSTPTSVTYYWNYVSVIQNWPSSGNVPPLPFVAMGIDRTRKTGYQLGGGVRNLRTVYFDVFATSQSERDDISDLIHNAIFNTTISILDFSAGWYLNYDGTFNTGLSLPLDSLGNLYFIETDQRNSYFPTDFTDLYKFRSVVNGTYETFVD